MSTEGPITILFYQTAKPELVDEFVKWNIEHARATRAEDEGCITFILYQRQDDPREFVLLEQWRDRASLEAHIARMQRVYGPPPPGKKGLPAALLDFLEKWQGVRVHPVT